MTSSKSLRNVAIQQQDSIGTGTFNDVMRAVIRMQSAWQRVNQLRAELKAAEREADAAELDLMDDMDTAGMKELKLPSGLKVSLGVAVRGGIGQERKDEAHRWLDENGHGDLIKRTVVVPLARGDERVNTVSYFLQHHKIDHTVTTSVHHSTLAAWLRRMFTQNTLPPLETFGVFVDRRPIISTSRKRSHGNDEAEQV